MNRSQRIKPENNNEDHSRLTTAGDIAADLSINQDNLKADGVKSAVSDTRGGGILLTEGNMGTNANTASHNMLTADGKEISRDVSGIALSMNMLGSDPGDVQQGVTHKKMIHG